MHLKNRKLNKVRKKNLLNETTLTNLIFQIICITHKCSTTIANLSASTRMIRKAICDKLIDKYKYVWHAHIPRYDI